ncbi:hypothetical protein HID58_047197 [Brassica napus]|uniref:Uncharacterized protein n=1 Tax=Brassica napus TaxID=3708 RepID=A0ABQ8AYR3_BRANA|nr:hypothetical protein HID58_047197 [Brassica napus]
MHKSEASHLAVHEHLRPPICAEEAVGFHKRVKRIYDPVKIVVPCDVFEVEFPIPPDKGAHLSSYVEDELPEATQREAKLQRRIDDLQGQVIGLHKTRKETNPELSLEFQILKEKLNEHSKQLEQSTEKLSQ